MCFQRLMLSKFYNFTFNFAQARSTFSNAFSTEISRASKTPKLRWPLTSPLPKMRILLLNLNPALVYSKDSDSQSSTLKNGKQVEINVLSLIRH